jgi:two-component system, NarL family, nitrate/nitrite response regulator NarL
MGMAAWKGYGRCAAVSGGLQRKCLPWWVLRWRAGFSEAAADLTAAAAPPAGGGWAYGCLPQRPGWGGGPQVRLVLCDNNRILCEALASILQARGHPVLAIATTAGDCIAAVAANRPDACLFDLSFPDGSGLDVAQAIRRCVPETKTVIFSCSTDPAVMLEAKKIGVAGFLRKDQKPEKITGALEVISVGKMAFDPGSSRPPSRRATVSPAEELLRKLTPRERQVLQRIVAGQSTEQMAREMDIAMSTLRSHIGHVLSKLGAHSRVQAAAIASRGSASDGFRT